MLPNIHGADYKRDTLMRTFTPSETQPILMLTGPQAGFQQQQQPPAPGQGDKSLFSIKLLLYFEFFRLPDSGENALLPGLQYVVEPVIKFI